MTHALTEIEQQASHLSEEERAQLAMFLLHSLEPVEHGDVGDAWRVEAEARLAQVKRGEARLVFGDEVFANIRRPDFWRNEKHRNTEIP